MSLYMPVKYALMIILLVCVVIAVLDLSQELRYNRSSSNQMVMLVLRLVVMAIGLGGAYKDNRQLLLTFAIILTVLVIVGVVQSQAIVVVGNAVLNIISIILAVYQSEMLRSGHL